FALTEGVLRAMLLTRLKVVGALFLTACLFGVAAVFAFHSAAAEPPGAKNANAAAPAAQAGGKGQTDQERMQGFWVLVAGEKEGKKLTAEELKQFRITVEFAGDKATVTTDNKVEEGTFRLDATTKPKEFDFILGGGGKNDVHPGIYKLDGNRL